ncbi:MAG: exodeoxyribonuclease VII large subunit XseA [Roseibaca calidilacus]|uniref:Exodeoxyribonuclease 7 large subunit n=1 Tax=Roseibaca calidilacus TaxID=1666912 RepID=A0A0P7VUF8_9RHOB|nr:exodeoxyribonuclease VII large subunit [Roseibaca calidilacus]KPP90731.1 MAG: exodeoxyribonuclease VII large subunit XseA [Roseibaca calidilacus]CUX83464.1 Exodeoxyribonuclease VII large subunit [Roseibaca calidilacus]
MDLIDEPQGEMPGNTPEFTVSDLSGAVKRTLEGEFGRVRVRGEVGRVVIARTGHMYFDLKDDRAVIAGVSWKGQVARMTVRPEEGMEVIATGRLTTFAPQSKYQLQVESIEPAGAGALMAMLDARRKALAAEGLFDAARKRRLPYLPRVVGVVTSPQGAVIRDILHRLRDRFGVHVLVWPVAVQGQACAPQVARAIEGFNALPKGGPIPRPDVLIVARGGGSIEDLWGFNEEIVVRAAAASEIPLISAVGHETDTTLIDHASDQRAPTPTAAAEIAVPVHADLVAHLSNLNARLVRGGAQSVALRRQRLRDLGRALPRPEALLAPALQRFDQWAERVPGSLRAALQSKRQDLRGTAAGLRPTALVAQIDRGRDRLVAQATRADRALLARQDGCAAQLGRAARLRPEVLLTQIAGGRERLHTQATRADRAATARLEALGTRLSSLERLRQSLGYPATLQRGYAVVREEGGGVVTSATRAGQAGTLKVEFRDGTLDVMAGKRPKPVKASTLKPDQGSLF